MTGINRSPNILTTKDAAAMEVVLTLSEAKINYLEPTFGDKKLSEEVEKPKIKTPQPSSLLTIKYRGQQRYKDFLDEKGRHCFRDMKDRIDFVYHKQRDAYRKLLRAFQAKDVYDLEIDNLPGLKPDPQFEDA